MDSEHGKMNDSIGDENTIIPKIPPIVPHGLGRQNIDKLSMKDILILIDEEIRCLNEEWQGQLPFPMHPVTDKSSMEECFLKPPESIDICGHIGGQSQYERIYFDPRTYPPPDGVDSTHSAGVDSMKNFASWSKLKFDLERAAVQYGNPVVSNGSSKGGSNDRRFMCACGINLKRSLQSKTCVSRDYRNTTMINDKKKQQTSG